MGDRLEWMMRGLVGVSLAIAVASCSDGTLPLSPNDGGPQEADAGPIDAAPDGGGAKEDSGALTGCDRLDEEPATSGFVERDPSEFPFDAVLGQDLPPPDRWWHYVSPIDRRGCISYRVEFSIVGRGSDDALATQGHYLVRACHECPEPQSLRWRTGLEAISQRPDPQGRADLFVQANENGLMLSVALASPTGRRRPMGCPVFNCTGFPDRAPRPQGDANVVALEVDAQALLLLHSVVFEGTRPWLFNEAHLRRNLRDTHPYLADPFDLTQPEITLALMLPVLRPADAPMLELSYEVECARAELPFDYFCASPDVGPEEIQGYETRWFEDGQLELPAAVVDTLPFP